MSGPTTGHLRVVRPDGPGAVTPPVPRGPLSGPVGVVGEHTAARSVVRELEDLTSRLELRGPAATLRAELSALLEAWATALLRVHRSRVAPTAPEAPAPWVLVAGLPSWIPELSPRTGPAWAVLAHPGTRAALTDVRQAWTADHLVHGEPAGDDLVVHRERGVVSASFLTSPGGLGDPRWDVATALDWLAVALGPVLDPQWQLDPVAELLAHYRRLGGQAEPDRSWAVVRTVTTAVEWTAQLGMGEEPPDDDTLGWLAGLWTRPLELLDGRPATRRRRR